MVQSGRSRRRWGTIGTLPGVQTDVMVVAASRDKRSLIAVSLSKFKAQYVAVKSQRPFQIGNLQMNVADADPGINCVRSVVWIHWLFLSAVFMLVSFAPPQMVQRKTTWTG